MDKIIVNGGCSLDGDIEISGAKNACLALMPAALLTEKPIILSNVPRLSDIDTMIQLLKSLGCEIKTNKYKNVLTIYSGSNVKSIAPYDIVRKMRASILVLGPLLARFGIAKVSLPGGCAIGARPVNIHLDAFTKMGASLKLEGGYINAVAKKGLKSINFKFPFVSVGATANIIMAATLAEGETTLENCAREPEIIDLCYCLNRMGAKIVGIGNDTLKIKGVSNLKGNVHKVIIDRIEMGTYMLAPIIAGGTINIKNGDKSLLGTFISDVRNLGAKVECNKNGIKVTSPTHKINPIEIITEPYPGFPTDLQAQMMAVLTLADGTSKIEEKIFENRFMHASELIRMGAKIYFEGNTAIVKGVDKIKGAPVMATDLRASVSLILAGLAANGETIISRVYHLDRGYEFLEKKLTACGASIKRVKN